MSIPVEQITEAALAFSSEVRALLADLLTESLDPITNEQDIRDLWAQEDLKLLKKVRFDEVESIAGNIVLSSIHKLF